MTLPVRPEQAVTVSQEAAVGVLLEERGCPPAERQQAGYPASTSRITGSPVLARLAWQARAARAPEPDPSAPRAAAGAVDWAPDAGGHRTLASMAAEAARWAAAAESGGSQAGESAG